MKLYLFNRDFGSKYPWVPALLEVPGEGRLNTEHITSKPGPSLGDLGMLAEVVKVAVRIEMGNLPHYSITLNSQRPTGRFYDPFYRGSKALSAGQKRMFERNLGSEFEVNWTFGDRNIAYFYSS